MASIIDLGSVHQPTSSSWMRCAVAAAAGGAAALILVIAMAPVQATEQYATTASRVATSQVAVAPQWRAAPAQQNAVMYAQQPATFDVNRPSVEAASNNMGPVLLAASGLMVLVGAAVRFFGSRSATESQEYSMLVTTAEQHRVAREIKEKERAQRVQQEIQERLLRLASMGAYVPQSGTPAAAPTQSASGTVSDWELRQQQRERAEREKADAKQREIQERLQRLSKLGAVSPEQVTAASAAAAPVTNEWERRQQERERHEKEQARAKQLEIQERLARLARMGAVPPPTAAPQAQPQAATIAAPTTANEWEVRQQQRERREQEIAAAKQREIQERLARLAQLGAAPVEAPASSYGAAPVVNDWERRQQERERAERAKAEAAKREIQERMARLARLSSGSA